MYSHIFDTRSGQWIRLTPDGDAVLTPDRAQASMIFTTQFESYIRNYEMEYLRGGLVLQACDETGAPIPI